MTVYRIAKWNEVFERAESRKLKQLTWIALPISLNSNGYQSLLDEFEADSPAIYGAWCALCAVAASCTVRGVLATSKGTELKVSHIARQTGFPSTVLEKLITWASSPSVNWLEAITANEVQKLLLENTAFPWENGTSGKSPDSFPARRENPPTTTTTTTTKPDQTLHDNNQPNNNRTSGDSVGFVGRLVVVEKKDLNEVCIEATKLLRLNKSFDPSWCWRMAWVAYGCDRGAVSEIITNLKSSDRPVTRPKKYIEAAVENICKDNEFDFKASCAAAPPSPALKVLAQ